MRKTTPPWLAAVAALCLCATASAREARRVFILHSYEEGHICGQPQHDGVVRALVEAGFTEGVNLHLGTYHMDTKRRNTTPEAIAREADRARDAIASFDPDVLVTLDDNAFRTVGLGALDTRLPVVFSGVNRPLDLYNRDRRFMESRAHPGHNITGVYEKLHFVEAVRVQSRILPGLERVVVLTDRSPTGRAIKAQVLDELRETDVAVPLEFRLVESWEQYKSTVTRLSEGGERLTLYPAALRLTDAAGNVYTAEEIFPWTVAHSRVPCIPINYAFMQAGMFGGAAVDFTAMGGQAGVQVVRILAGDDPGEIPVEDASRTALVFNLARAQALGLRIPNDILLAADEVMKGTSASLGPVSGDR